MAWPFKEAKYYLKEKPFEKLVAKLAGRRLLEGVHYDIVRVPGVIQK